jgi:hypothetical protein
MSALEDALSRLDPLHEAMDRFEKGGKRCALEIEQLHAELVAGLAEFDELAEEVEALRAEFDGLDEFGEPNAADAEPGK